MLSRFSSLNHSDEINDTYGSEALEDEQQPFKLMKWARYPTGLPFMKINTIDGKQIDTAKLPDLRAEMVEVIEKSGILEFAKKHDGLCYAFICIPNEKSWATMHLNTPEKFYYFVSLVDELVQNVTDNKMRLAIVPKE
jgi:hypothetical protein